MPTEIPIQKLAGKKRHQDKIFDIEKWGTFTNGYDTSKPHKHNYFEILIFFKISRPFAASVFMPSRK